MTFLTEPVNVASHGVTYHETPGVLVGYGYEYDHYGGNRPDCVDCAEPDDFDGYLDVPVSTRGGGGTLNIYWWGVPRHLKKGGLRHGHSPKKGGLRHGNKSKKGWGLRHEHESKKGGGGVLRTGLVKKTILVTDVQKGILGAYLLITFIFSL